jgi:predicted nucleic acid-binding protein
MSVVLDCSATMPWCFEDEANADTDALLTDIATRGAIVPGLWFLEVANVLSQAEKRGRIAIAKVETILDLLASLPIRTEPGDGFEVWRHILPLARQTGLTIYDATYLDLARRHGLPLATLDGELAKAARQIGVPTLLDRPTR